MSSPTTPKAALAKPASPSPTSSPETPRANRTYTRYAPVDFGARLANARNLRPDEAPPAPPPHVAAPASEGGVIVQPPVHSAFGSTLSHRVGPKYGAVPGSYVSPYDPGGKTPGNTRLPNSSITEAEFEAKYGSTARRALYARSDRTVTTAGGVRIAFGDNEPTTIPDKGDGSVASVVEAKAVPQVPKDAKDRLILLGPFRLIRKACATIPDKQGYGDMQAWLDAHMHEELHKVAISDEMLPEVVYAVNVPMTDRDWKFYNDALAMCFPEALELHDALAPGKENLDHFTYGHEFHQTGFVGEPTELTRDALTVPGRTKEEMLAMMVKQHRLSLPWDYGRPVHFRPELVPEELGGKLKDFQS